MKKPSGTSAGEKYLSAAPFVPDHPTLAKLRKAAAECQGCDLWKHATQTVFGEGPEHAPIMLVGEQPGDREDIEGRPFVGPAGRVLDEALAQVGLDRSQVYVTNIVKHFRWVAASRGKKRIHKKPRASQINACRPWFDAEVAVVRPQVIVCLGATAAQALLGSKFSVLRERGRLRPFSEAPWIMATVHPSSILRAPDSETRHAEMKRFVEDLRKIMPLLRGQTQAA
jgi:uracil-DNA glycosylase